MRIGICNEFWATAGGGEVYTLALAAALKDFGDVELIAPPGVQWDMLADRLQTETAVFKKRDASFEDAAKLSKISKEYDLFVNTSFGSSLANRGKHAILVVHFPFALQKRRRSAIGAIRRTAATIGALDESTAVEWGEGFGPWEGSPRFRWSDGDAELRLWLAPGVTKDVAVGFGADRPAPGVAEVVYEGTRLAWTDVGPGQSGAVTFKATGRSDGEPIHLRIRCDRFRPVDHGLSTDTRELGVQVTAVDVGRGLERALNRRLLRGPEWDPRAWLHSYDCVVVTSEFVRTWMRKRWGVDAEVVYPGVAPLRPLPKANVILSVGRFFPPERGHSKRQLEMVQAFRALVEGGLDGWELHLVGGCQPEDHAYLESVRAEARGLPVHFHVDLPGPLLYDLYGRASIYWHATGLSVKKSMPEAMEHFGISVVEAMSAGAVPVVFGEAGPTETVRHGVDGLHFRTIAELVDHTRSLVDDAARLQQLRESAVRRAQAYGPAELHQRMTRLVQSITAPQSPFTQTE